MQEFSCAICRGYASNRCIRKRRLLHNFVGKQGSCFCLEFCKNSVRMACLLEIFSLAIIIVFDGLLRFEIQKAQIFLRLNKDIEPPKICSTEIHSLLALKPACHLNDIVTFVAGSVPLLCVINMEPLRVLRIKTIKAAKENYGVD